MWKSPRYGAINLMGRRSTSGEDRTPWYYAGGAGGKDTHMNTIYMNIRYTLPGGMPAF